MPRSTTVPLSTIYWFLTLILLVASVQSTHAISVMLKTYDGRVVQVAHTNPSEHGNINSRGSVSWWIEDLGAGNTPRERRVALRGINGNYLAAENDGTVRVDRTQVGDWEVWTMVDVGDGYYALRSHHGQYLSYEEETTLVADRSAVGDWERFALLPDLGQQNCTSGPVEFGHSYWTGCTACPGSMFANCNDGYVFVEEQACADNALLCTNLCEKKWYMDAVQCDEFELDASAIRLRPPWVINTIDGPTNPVDGGRTFDGQTTHTLGKYVLPPAFTLFVEIQPDGSQGAQQWEHVIELGMVEHGWNAPLRVEVDDASLYVGLGDGQSFVEATFGGGAGGAYQISYDLSQSRGEVYRNGDYLGEIFAYVNVGAVPGTMILGSAKGTERFYRGDVGVVEFQPGIATPPDGNGRELNLSTGLLEFSGSSGHVVGRSDKEYFLPSAFTVQADVRVDASDQWDHLIEFGAPGYEWKEPLRIEVGNEGEWYIAIGDGSTSQEATFQGAWKYGDWVKIHFTYDPGLGVGSLYENGVHLGDIHTSLEPGGVAGRLKLGMHEGHARFFSGALRNLRIHPGGSAP